MKFTEEILKKHSSTAQVKLLTLEFLSDGKMHNRKEIVSYIREREKFLNLEHFTPGCISGGIYQAVNIKGCEKNGSANYILTLSLKELAQEIPVADILAKKSESVSLGQRVSSIFGDFYNKMLDVSRTVDFVSASDSDCEALNLMRESMRQIKKFEENFKNLDKKK